MDIALSNALSAKKQLEADIHAMTQRLRKVEAFISLYDEFAKGVTSLPPLPPLPELPKANAASNAGSKKQLSVGDAVHSILSDGYPRTTAVLLNLLESQFGIIIGGERKTTNLSSTLSRDNRFDNVRHKGWILKESPKPASPSSVDADEGLFSN